MVRRSYEAGASVEVAPVDALGSGGWGRTKTPKRRDGDEDDNEEEEEEDDGTLEVDLD